jgi:hypothetical protein
VLGNRLRLVGLYELAHRDGSVELLELRLGLGAADGERLEQRRADRLTLLLARHRACIQQKGQHRLLNLLHAATLLQHPCECLCDVLGHASLLEKRIRCAAERGAERGRSHRSTGTLSERPCASVKRPVRNARAARARGRTASTRGVKTHVRIQIVSYYLISLFEDEIIIIVIAVAECAA